MRLRLIVARNAEREIREAAQWWDENRPLARELFRQELARGFDLITTHPEIGPRATSTRAEGIRRLHLGRIRFYLYYRIRQDGKAVQVLALWHTSRGGLPAL